MQLIIILCNNKHCLLDFKLISLSLKFLSLPTLSEDHYIVAYQIGYVVERPGLESQRSRKRHFFHRKIFKFFKILFIRFTIDFN